MAKNQNTAPFIKLYRESSNFDELVRRRPTAFVLLTIIAKRARRKNDNNFDDLQVGEALIGDHDFYCATRQNYRSDLKLLKTFNFVTIKPTRRGTIVKIVDTTILDINAEVSNQQSNHQPTISQPSANHQPTTNKNDKNDKNEKEIDIYLSEFNKLFGTNFQVTEGRVRKLGLRLGSYSLSQILDATRNLSKSKFHRGENDRGWKADPDFLLRADEQVDRWLNAGMPEKQDVSDPKIKKLLERANR